MHCLLASISVVIDIFWYPLVCDILVFSQPSDKTTMHRELPTPRTISPHQSPPVTTLDCFQIFIMNLRKKSRSKLRIFGSFSSKVRQFRSETDLREKSTPVLLAVNPRPENSLTSLTSLTPRCFSVSLSYSSPRHRSGQVTH